MVVLQKQTEYILCSESARWLSRLDDLQFRTVCFLHFLCQIFYFFQMILYHCAEIIVIKGFFAPSCGKTVLLHRYRNRKNRKALSILVFIQVGSHSLLLKGCLLFSVKRPVPSVDTLYIGVNLPVTVSGRAVNVVCRRRTGQSHEHAKKKHDRKNPHFFLPCPLFRGISSCCSTAVRQHLPCKFLSRWNFQKAAHIVCTILLS